MTRQKKVEIVPEAIEEVRMAADWYGQRDKTAQTRLRLEFKSALLRIGRSPKIYPPYIGGTRWCRLRRFPYLVVFRERGDQIQVVAVDHERQRGGYWLSRLESDPQ